jgi:hypothetical protein
MKFELFQFNVFDRGFLEDWSAIKFKLVSYIPTIPAIGEYKNGESFKGIFFVSTGAGTTLDFNGPYAAKNNVVAKTGEHFSYLTKGLEDKESVHYEGRINYVLFGASDAVLEMGNLPVGISQATAGIQGSTKVSGILGNRVLSRFNIVFDYSKSMMYAQNRAMDNQRSFSVNSCGLELQYSKDMKQVLIHRIYEKGPARGAGIRVDDELLKVNGKPVSEMTLPEIEKILNTPDTTVTIVIKQGGSEREIELELEELI